MSLQPHTVVIGGTRIGRAVATCCLANDHKLTLLSRRPPQTSEREFWSELDVTDAAAVRAIFPRLVQSRGNIHNLVFLQRYRGTDDAWSSELATSLTGVRSAIENAIPHFATAEACAIVAVGSVAGRMVASEQGAAYHVAKAGVESLVRYYAVLLGPRGIRVNGVCPGTIVKDESRAFYEDNRNLQGLYRKIIPLGRMGDAGEVANVVMFLCSAKASYLTGQNIVVDGGLSLQYQESLCRKLTDGSPAQG